MKNAYAKLLAIPLLVLSLSAATPAAEKPAVLLPVYGYKIVHTYPHDTKAFTEGLLYRDGFLYESTGLKGHSTIRKVDLKTGHVLQSKELPPQYFGEGLTEWNDTLVGLTWQTNVGFVFDLASFDVKREFAFSGEGWGLTHNDHALIMSDGSATLRELDPQTFKEVRRIPVTADGIAVDQINELEWVGDEIYANLWHTNVIARIDPASGKIVGWIDLSGIYQQAGMGENGDDVLNGIAYDAKNKRLFVTGKLWPKVYEIQLVPRPMRHQ